MGIPERIQAIKDADPNWRDDPRTLEVAKLAWGVECHVNAHGVFDECVKEVVAKCGRAVAEVGICRVREHVYVFCTRMETCISGYSYAPGIWHSQPHGTEDEARRAAIQELLGRTADKPGHSNAEKAELMGLRMKLREQVAQPTLFG